MSATEQLNAVVTGRVQGVGFRYFVVRTARALGLTGRVTNEHDGSVHVVAEGDPERLSALEVRLREGPPGAVVTAVSARRTEAGGSYTGFDVDHAR